MFVTKAKFTKVIEKLNIGNTLRVDKIYPEYVRSLDAFWLSRLTHFFNIKWQLKTAPLGWENRQMLEVCSNRRGLYFSASL